MITIEEFLEFICSLPDPVVQIHNFGKARYHTVDFRILTKDIMKYDDFILWWRGMNMTPHLNNTIALTILGLGPPESIKNAMLFLML